MFQRRRSCNSDINSSKSFRESLDELKQSIEYLSQFARELDLQEQRRRIHAKQSIKFQEDGASSKIYQQILNDGVHPQVTTGDPDEFLEMNEVDHQILGEESEGEVVGEEDKLFDVCVENATTTTFIKKSDDNEETKKMKNSDTWVTKAKEDSLIKREGSLKLKWSIKFERIDQWRMWRSAQQKHYTFVVGREESYKLRPKAQEDDYKLALQGDLLDSRTNLFEEREDDMN